MFRNLVLFPSSLIKITYFLRINHIGSIHLLEKRLFIKHVDKAGAGGSEVVKALGSGVHSETNRNGYQKQKNNVSGQ
jgi:hypothetical protein